MITGLVDESLGFERSRPSWIPPWRWKEMMVDQRESFASRGLVLVGITSLLQAQDGPTASDDNDGTKDAS